MIGTGVHGLNALQIILASGFSGLTDVGHIPNSVIVLAALPQHVTLVRANESVNFKLSAKRGDMVRSDTTVHRWLVETSKSVVETPDYFLTGSKPNTFQLLRCVQPPPKYQEISYLRLPIKFVPSSMASSHESELWISTAVMHTRETVATYLARGIPIGAQHTSSAFKATRLKWRYVPRVEG